MPSPYPTWLGPVLENGMRVAIHPATDAWMQGDRYGYVVRIGRKWIFVRCDRSERVRRFHPDNVTPI